MASDMLEMKQLGLSVRFLRTDGEVLEMEVSGRPRGFLAQRHVHNWAIARAVEGLEPYAQRAAAGARSAAGAVRDQALTPTT